MKKNLNMNNLHQKGRATKYLTRPLAILICPNLKFCIENQTVIHKST